MKPHYSELLKCCLNGHFVHDQVWIALLLIAVCYNPRNGNTLLLHSAQVLVPELYKILISGHSHASQTTLSATTTQFSKRTL